MNSTTPDPFEEMREAGSGLSGDSSSAQGTEMTPSDRTDSFSELPSALLSRLMMEMSMEENGYNSRMICEKCEERAGTFGSSSSAPDRGPAAHGPAQGLDSGITSHTSGGEGIRGVLCWICGLSNAVNRIPGANAEGSSSERGRGHGNGHASNIDQEAQKKLRASYQHLQIENYRLNYQNGELKAHISHLNNELQKARERIHELENHPTALTPELQKYFEGF
ncbi:hypothetical protein FQN49_006900 [Arthroderma sp. PD_2]|nr:hypothetical protein FQN49_006900 [Arthroderma sp. PD_2]